MSEKVDVDQQLLSDSLNLIKDIKDDKDTETVDQLVNRFN